MSSCTGYRMLTYLVRLWSKCPALALTSHDLLPCLALPVQCDERQHPLRDGLPRHPLGYSYQYRSCIDSRGSLTDIWLDRVRPSVVEGFPECLVILAPLRPSGWVGEKVERQTDHVVDVGRVEDLELVMLRVPLFPVVRCVLVPLEDTSASAAVTSCGHVKSRRYE